MRLTTKKLLTGILFLFSVSFIQAQKFGKVDYSIVAQNTHAIDSSAEAAYIFKKAKVRFEILQNDIFMVLEHHDRIKIYNEKGENYAKYSIPLYRDGSTREKVTKIKAMTFNIENDKVVSSKLSKKDQYNEESSEHYSYHKFALPDAKAGSVLDVQYTIRTPYKFVIPTFNFQANVPVDEAEYEVRIPPYYTYTPIAHGAIPLNHVKKEVKGSYQTDIAHTFKASDIPALLPDDYVLNINDYRSSLKYELYSSQFPNSTQQFYVKDWNEIAKDLMDHKYFGKEIGKRTKDLEPIIDELEGKTEEEKIAAIYSHVQKNFSWNGDYGYQKREGIKDLLKNKSGNVGDINLLLLNLLLQADIDARPFLLKTRNSGLLNQSYPSRSEMNYLLVYIRQGESFTLLDGTCKYSPIGQLPLRASNINGLLITGDKGKIIDIQNSNNYKSVTMANYAIDVEGPSLTGTGKRMLKNYAAASYRRNQDEGTEEEDVEEEGDDEEGNDEEWDEEVKVENEYEIIEVKNLEDINKDITMSYTEVIYNQLDKIGDQIFIDAAIDFGIDDNPFFEEDRNYPVFYGFLSDTRQVIKIELPEGYEVESAPESSAMTLEGGKAKFMYEVKLVGKELVIDYTFKVNTDIFLADEYPNLKELYNRIVSKSKEKIVLRKAT